MIHDNSIDAYYQEKPKLGGRRRKIIEVFFKEGSSLSDRQVLNRLKLHDMNQVRPRITELVNEGYLEELGHIKDAVTDKKVRTCRIINNKPEQIEMEV